MQLNITKEIIDQYINEFDSLYGSSDKVIINLFCNSNNNDFDSVFCRCGLVDLMYSTGIQRYNKGGIINVANHILSLHTNIDNAVKNDIIDYELFRFISDVNYSNVKEDSGTERKIYSFASKYLSFCNPKIYPIMDRYVKAVIGVPENVDYEYFCNALLDYKSRVIDVLGDYSLKKADKFLWLYGKRTFSNSHIDL